MALSLGLKIDVCTYEGLRAGVPNLLRLLRSHGITASFFVAMGPDTSGRAILQALRPGFLTKMRRTRAVQTYGLRTILSGTILPSRHLGRGLAPLLREVVGTGHELAIHGYNHRRWQDRLDRMAELEVREEVRKAVAVYGEVVGAPPRGFGAPGWQVTPASLRVVDEAGFAYASDTRGSRPFFPCMAGEEFRTLQLPTTVPTLDEVLGLNGMDADRFVDLVRQEVKSRPGNVLTLHAEMEGMRFQEMTRRLLTGLLDDGVACAPLAALVDQVRAGGEQPPTVEVIQRPIRGRAGTVAMPAAFPVT